MVKIAMDNFLGRRLLRYTAIAAAALLASCGGGSGGGDAQSFDQGPYTVTARAGEGGSVTPTTQVVEQGGTAAFTLSAAAGYSIDEVTGCNGSLSGTVYTTGPITADCSVSATFSANTYSVGGRVSGLSGTLVLQLELADTSETLSVTSEGTEVKSFSFAAEAREGSAFEAGIVEQPQDQECTLNQTFGEVSEQSHDQLRIECVASTTTSSVSGTIVPAANIDADSDVNDPHAEYADNSSPSRAQIIGGRATLHGFASAEPAGGTALEARFADSIDRNDYFRTSLMAGQRVQLQVVDFEGFNLGQQYQGDLDLYLLNAEGDVVAFSDSTTEFEEVVVPVTGEYFVNVYAFEGISKYVLRMKPAPLEELSQTQAEDPVQLVPDEAIIKYEKEQVSTAAGAKGRHTDRSHQQAGRAALVKLKESLTMQAAARPAMQELQSLNPRGHAKLKTLHRIKKLRTQPGVIYAEPNYVRQAHRVPNDPAYSLQWHYNAIDLPQAWDLTTGESADAPIVAVLDTGVFLEHRDLAGQLIDGYDFVSDIESAGDGDGPDPNPDDPGDSETRGQSSWHGTHVAGTVAAASDNDQGVAGTAWGARIMPVRVLGRSGGTSYDVIQGLRYAAGLPNDSGTRPARPADIANLSLGGPHGSLAEQEAFEEARATGMIIVAAAGNENSSVPSYPAAYQPVLSVSATDYRGDRAPYSNYGETIDLAAPGGNRAADLNNDGYGDGVLSTLVDDTSGTRESALAFYHGTSMAAPHVSGVIALMKAIYPELTPDELDLLLAEGELTDDLGPAGRDDVYGHGLINALRAVQSAESLASGGNPPEPSPQVVVNPSVVELPEPTDSARVELTNEGGGDPTVLSVDVDVNWLTVTAGETDAAGLGTYDLAADRSGLADGRYQARVSFSISTGNVVEVLVYLQVGDTVAAGYLTQMYVVLLNEADRELVDVVAAQGDGESLSYSFSDVPVGDYFIVAGSDIDADGVICQSGESCGAYPTLNRQQAVEVRGENLSDLDFVAEILSTFSASEAAAERDISISPARQP